jgi:hypothetical protein
MNMADITEIPLDELLADRDASVQDIRICNLALASGVTHHRDGFPVKERIDGNERIISKINAELALRAALSSARGDAGEKEQS